MINIACASQPTASNHINSLSHDSNKIILSSELKWEALNPARGAKSPRAATLWGDRHDQKATGFLVKFVKGFSSPPHIHNTSYRAVVIRGLIHNDDPSAEHMWMPAGSFWTQPQGEIHITAAMGNDNLTLVEIDKGPYLVKPTESAFDSGERPMNIDVSNLVWLDLAMPEATQHNIKIAYLWGLFENGHFNGSFIKLPANIEVNLISHAETFHAVVITGELVYGTDQIKTLAPGSYFGSNGTSAHTIASNKLEENIIYIRTNGDYSIDRIH